jgi:hypothetical protein
MAANRNPGKEHGQWGLAVKDLFFIPMAAIIIIDKEHGQWLLAVKDLFSIPMAAIRSTGEKLGQMGVKSQRGKYILWGLSDVLVRSTGSWGRQSKTYKISYGGHEMH